VFIELRKRIARAIAPAQTRAYDGASFGRFPSNFRSGRTVNEVSAAQPTLMARGRFLYQNNPYFRNAANVWAAALTGAGITPSPRIANWDSFVRAADADGRSTLYGLWYRAVLAWITDGEAFITWIETDQGPKLRLIPSDMIDMSDTRTLEDGRQVINGIEHDADGVRTAYYISPARPTDQFATYAPPVRVPASEVIHLYSPEGIGAVRGVSWAASVIARFAELGQLEDSLLVQAKVAALHCGVVTDMNGTTADPYAETPASLEPGSMIRLGAGLDVKFPTLPQAPLSIELAQMQLRAIAMGMGLPEYLLSGDMRNANFSSMRSSMIAWRQRVEVLQYQEVVPTLCDPIYSRVALASGENAAPPEWYVPPIPWVDPLKDAEAEIALINAGLKSRRQAVAATGYNIEELDAEIAADRAREKSLGLTFGAPAKAEKPAEKKDDDNAE